MIGNNVTFEFKTKIQKNLAQLNIYVYFDNKVNQGFYRGDVNYTVRFLKSELLSHFHLF